MKSSPPFSRVACGWPRLTLLALILVARPLRADVLLAWNEALEAAAGASDRPLTPEVEARAFAMTHLGMAEAMAAIARAGTKGPVLVVNQQVAASAAAHTVLSSLMPGATARFDAVHDAQVAAVPAGPERERAAQTGREAAALVLQKRDGDKWIESSTGPTGAALLRLNPAVALGGAESAPRSPWATATPFVLKKTTQFEPNLPYWLDLDGQRQPHFGVTRTRIFDTVDRRTPSDHLRHFWSGSPVISWNRIARVMVARSGGDLAARARALAVVNLAMADATLCASHWQFTLGQWQSRWKGGFELVDGPALSTDVTVVHLDGRVQALTLRPESHQVMDPPLPGYPSMGATVGSAATAALSSLIDAKTGFTLPPPSGSHGAPRIYGSLAEAARECAYVSSLEGQNARHASVAGYRLGESIGSYVAKQARARRW